MVKGTNKRVIVVRSPDPQMFEEAIFVVRDDFARRSGSDRQVMEQVRRTATEYAKRASGKRRSALQKLRILLFASAGALSAGAVWLILYLCGS